MKLPCFELVGGQPARFVVEGSPVEVGWRNGEDFPKERWADVGIELGRSLGQETSLDEHPEGRNCSGCQFQVYDHVDRSRGTKRGVNQIAVEVETIMYKWNQDGLTSAALRLERETRRSQCAWVLHVHQQQDLEEDGEGWHHMRLRNESVCEGEAEWGG